MKGLLSVAAASFVLWSSHAAPCATIQAGGGVVAVTQGPDSENPGALTREVFALAGMSGNMGTDQSGTALRLQFLRPDSEAVGFLVIVAPVPPTGISSFDANSPWLDLLYYEQSPDNPREKLFVSAVWDGDIATTSPTLSTRNQLRLGFDLVVIDVGPDGIDGSSDDRVRRLQADNITVEARGDMTAATYASDQGNVYVSSETIVVYDDGCSRDTDYYDDSDYSDYDSSWDSSDSSFGDSSCEGDTYDDSDWDSSDSSGSCDSDDWDDSDDSGDWEGDWETGSSSTDGDFESSHDTEVFVMGLRTMSWLSPLMVVGRRLVHGPFRRMLPLIAGLLLLGVLRIRSTRASYVASPGPSESSPPTPRRQKAYR